MGKVNKNNVLASWIDIEKFSEGDIDLKAGDDKNYKQLRRADLIDNWTNFFKAKLSEFRYRNKISKEKVKNMGFTIYFDIFRFDDLINDLSEKFNLPEEYREDSNSNKFTYCLSFSVAENSFKLLEDQLFYTMSGYAHRYGKLPENILEVKTDLGKQIAEFFEYDFEDGMMKLISQELRWSTRNYYVIHEDVTKGEPLLHSFYLDDLLWAKNEDYELLDRYIDGFSGKQINLDSNNKSSTFNGKNIAEILEPKNYPLGRFPSNPKWGLSLMQQIAVNVALNDPEKIRGVNGPPGTGKTTLLKDVFAELVVRQAYEISKLKDKHLTETHTYFRNGKIAQLPVEIADKNILVASSNNGAVQNIVKELPQKGQLSDEFLKATMNVDYFSNISNSDGDFDNWGMFATEGGKSTNRQKMQNLFDACKKKEKLRLKLEVKQQEYRQELSEKEATYEQLSCNIEELENLVDIQARKASVAKEQVVNKDYRIELIDSKIDETKRHKPAMFTLKKFICPRSVETYVNEINELKSSKTALLQERVELQARSESVQRQLIESQENLQKSTTYRERFQAEIISWKQESEIKLSRIEKKISSLELKLKDPNYMPLDLSLAYADLQQTAPWSTKEYRTEQSKLFIYALAVRKQFLHENSKSLKGSWNIWNRIADYSVPHKKHLIAYAWDWVNFAIPVISTTFASFHGMFRNMGAGSIANLFIDEAGQATPQSAVGAILRSKKVMAVGDPAQIPPVIPLSNGLISLIANKNNASEQIVNGDESVQTLVDSASRFGYQKTEDEWIGMPLWVHRRCLDPMFSISNQISYAGQMVLADSMSQAGKGAWVDISGRSDDKFVQEQANWLKNEILRRASDGEVDTNNIYVISPFKNVVTQLKQYLQTIGFPQKNIGTVHTFQGKEAAIVYLVLGASFEESGAASWAVSTPNLMNVAATRAKKEFYIVGDKKLYKSLNSEVVIKTLSVLENTDI